MDVKKITFTGLFAALIFIFTFTFKIPSISGLGYAHLGDMFIIISVWMLGRKHAPLAAGIGAALADIASGFAIWALPTFMIKFIMASIIGIIAEKILEEKYMGYLIGTIVGGLVHIAGYLLAWIVIGGGMAAAVGAFVPLSIQTLIGIVLGNIVVFTFIKSSVAYKMKAMVKGDLA